MADNITLKTFASQSISPTDDALLYETAVGSSGMFKDMTITIADVSTLHLTGGYGALCGREFVIDECDVAVTLSTDSTLLGRLYVHMDLSDTDEPISLIVETGSSLSDLTQDTNCNYNSGVYEIELCTFNVSTTTISDLVATYPLVNKEQNLATIETSDTASTDYSEGEYLVYAGLLYEVIADIAEGDTLEVGTNIEQTTVGDEISELKSDISELNNSISELGTSNSATVNSTYCTGFCKYTTIGNLVFVHYRLVLSTAISSSVTLVSDLPSLSSGILVTSGTLFTSEMGKIGIRYVNHQTTTLKTWGSETYSATNILEGSYIAIN